MDVPEGPEAVGRLIERIRAEVPLVAATSAEAFYDRMESQSGRALPILYQPFDAGARSHFADRGRILDYALAAAGAGSGCGRVLDFGPGDGWPSLLVAPFAAEVVSVDASPRRIAVCAENARRLGVGNARFVHVPAGARLPFPDESFDAVLAASSVEQAPDPRAALGEFRRVLAPGGVLRVFYEALGRYGEGREREAERAAGGLLVYDRDLTAETVTHYFLEEPVEAARMALTWSTRQPSGPTLVRWLMDAGFSRVLPTDDGGRAAAALFDRLPATGRPRTLAEVDALLRPVVEAALATPRPVAADPMFTAVR